VRAEAQPQEAQLCYAARAWCGGSFDPEAFDAAAINRAFHGGWIPPEAW